MSWVSSQQPQPGRLQRLPQRPFGLGALLDIVARLLQFRRRPVHCLAINVELGSENLQEALAALGFQRQINPSQVSGAGAGRDLAAARFQTIAHLGLEDVPVLFGQMGAWGGGQQTTPPVGDLAPGFPQILHGAVQ